MDSDLVSLVCHGFVLVVDLIVVFESEYGGFFECGVFVGLFVVQVDALVQFEVHFVYSCIELRDFCLVSC